MPVNRSVTAAESFRSAGETDIMQTLLKPPPLSANLADSPYKHVVKQLAAVRSLSGGA